MNDKELDKWLQSINPYFVALGGRRKFNFPPFTPIPWDDLMRQFREKAAAGDIRGAELILNQLRGQLGIKPPQGKLERDVEIALLSLSDHKPAIAEIFRMVRRWDKSYTEMGVRTVIKRRNLGFRISPCASVGRPRKKY